MKVFVIILLSTCLLVEANQLDKLIRFVKGGGSNPAPNGRGGAQASRTAPAPAAVPAPFNRRPQTQRRVGGGAGGRAGGGAGGGAGPIPFSEVADGRRGVVEIDVPQPSRTQSFVGSQQAVVQASIPAPTPTFAGLPAGARQIGGNPVKMQTAQRKRPAPLSEIQPPIYLSQTFPSPLNEVNPFSPSRLEPVEALSHNLLPGNVPRPLGVQQHVLPVVRVLGNPSTQNLVNNNNFDYDRFANEVFREDQGNVVASQQINGEHRPVGGIQDVGAQQKDVTHSQALENHRAQVEKVKRLQQQAAQEQISNQQFVQTQFQPQQQQFQPQQHQFQPQQQQFQPPQVHQHSPVSHFNIPGQDTHRQFANELKLAQDALAALGSG